MAARPNGQHRKVGGSLCVFWTMYVMRSNWPLSTKTSSQARSSLIDKKPHFEKRNGSRLFEAIPLESLRVASAEHKEGARKPGIIKCCPRDLEIRTRSTNTCCQKPRHVTNNHFLIASRKQINLNTLVAIDFRNQKILAKPINPA